MPNEPKKLSIEERARAKYGWPDKDSVGDRVLLARRVVLMCAEAWFDWVTQLDSHDELQKPEQMLFNSVAKMRAADALDDSGSSHPVKTRKKEA
jgi:hypothetical protein